MSHTPIYARWKNMRDRCNNPNNKYYCNYGGRGIKISKEWDDFLVFYKDMKGEFEKHLELNRIDNDGNYGLNNCNWVTRKENSCNKRTNQIFNGETASAASMRLANNTNLVSSRIRKGWEISRAFSEPKNQFSDTSTKEWTTPEKKDCQELKFKEFSKKYKRTYGGYVQMRHRLRLNVLNL